MLPVATVLTYPSYEAVNSAFICHAKILYVLYNL